MDHDFPSRPTHLPQKLRCKGTIILTQVTHALYDQNHLGYPGNQYSLGNSSKQSDIKVISDDATWWINWNSVAGLVLCGQLHRADLFSNKQATGSCIKNHNGTSSYIKTLKSEWKLYQRNRKTILIYEVNRPISQIPECICAISHNAPFCNRNVHMCAHFSYKMMHCGIWHRCILGFVRWVYCMSVHDLVTSGTRASTSGYWLLVRLSVQQFWPTLKVDYLKCTVYMIYEKNITKS